MSAYYQDDSVTLLLGDAAAVAATLEPQSVQTVVTSPPYFGLRDYGVEGQLGAEESPAEFVAALVAVFEAIRPALKDDGTLWVNLGDSYSGYHGNARVGDGPAPSDKPGYRENMRVSLPGQVPAKNLLGIPWRFAFAMQDAGWVLRNDIIWAKPNGMPSSVTDRMSSKHEHVFLFSKKPRYYFNLEAVLEPLAASSLDRLAQDVDAQAGSDRVPGKTNGTMKAVSRRDSFARSTKDADVPGQSTRQHREDRPNVVAGSTDGKNPGDVWTMATQPFSGAHFATFPPQLPERCILAGSRPGDTVLDPFSGSGTTGMVAGKHGRRYIGIDLNPEYHQLALKTRLAQGALL